MHVCGRGRSWYSRTRPTCRRSWTRSGPISPPRRRVCRRPASRCKTRRPRLKLTDEQTRSGVAEAKAALDAAKQQLRRREKRGAYPGASAGGSGRIRRQGASADRESSRADLVSAQADYTRAQSDLKRYQSLYAQSAIPAQQLDQYKSVADSAQAHVDAARAKARVSAADSQSDSRRRNR